MSIIQFWSAIKHAATLCAWHFPRHYWSATFCAATFSIWTKFAAVPQYYTVSYKSISDKVKQGMVQQCMRWGKVR